MHIVCNQIDHIFNFPIVQPVLQHLLTSPAQAILLLEPYSQLLREVEYAVHGGCESTFKDLVINLLARPALAQLSPIWVSLSAQTRGLQVLDLSGDTLKEGGQITTQVVVLLFGLLAGVHVVTSSILELLIKFSLSLPNIHAYCLILYILLQCIQHQVVQAVLPVIESWKVIECLSIILERLLPEVKTDKQAWVEKDQHDKDVEGKLDFLPEGYLLYLSVDLIRARACRGGLGIFNIKLSYLFEVLLTLSILCCLLVLTAVLLIFLLWVFLVLVIAALSILHVYLVLSAQFDTFFVTQFSWAPGFPPFQCFLPNVIDCGAFLIFFIYALLLLLFLNLLLHS